MNLAEYTTPISVDHFGNYRGKKPGDKFEVMYDGKVYAVEVIGKATHRPNGTILREARFQQVEGPVTKDFVAHVYRMPGGRLWSTARGWHKAA